ncbi:MAG: TetR/AcrR family transcriptional regulator [Myxococcota bacterium]|nr:TetR/AcrR family transcriptional regulator [Myxococcota bacterium]
MENTPAKKSRQYGGMDADERRTGRREKFLEAGIEAFGTTGYAKSTIQGICRIAGLTERYFYESFTSKEDLLCAVHRRLIKQLEVEAQTIIETPDISPMATVYGTTEMLYARFKEDPRRSQILLIEMLGVSPRASEEYQRGMVVLTTWIELIASVLLPDIDPERLRATIIPTACAGAIIQVANQWVLDGFKTPLDELTKQTIRFFVAMDDFFRKESDKVSPDQRSSDQSSPDHNSLDQVSSDQVS